MHELPSQSSLPIHTYAKKKKIPCVKIEKSLETERSQSFISKDKWPQPLAIMNCALKLATSLATSHLPWFTNYKLTNNHSKLSKD